jgi:hemoglobin
MKQVGLLLLLSLLLAGCWFDPEAGTRPVQPAKEPEKPLYQRLGKEEGINRIVDEWITRSLSDPRVNFIRRGSDQRRTASDSNIARVKIGFVQFLSATTGGPVKYQGRDMKSLHQGMQISGGEFDATKRHLKETLKMLKIAEKDQNELFKVIESVRKDIVEVP